MSIDLSQIEIRVLGVLMEKALTQPATYPMTLNAIVLGANQKQNRDPVMECTESQVASAVYELERRQLVTQAAAAAGARANRFAHNVVERLHWDRRAQAIMAELMLRGAQTGGELRSRASRMTPFPDLPSVTVTLQELTSGDPLYVEELPREPGKSANRFRHLLTPATSPPADRPQAGDEAANEPAPSLALLSERLGKLEAQVARLAQLVEGCEVGGGDGNESSGVADSARV